MNEFPERLRRFSLAYYEIKSLRAQLALRWVLLFMPDGKFTRCC